MRSPIEFFEYTIRKQQRKGDNHLWPHMNMGHLAGAILSIHNLRDATLFRTGYIEWMKVTQEVPTPEAKIVDSNIGWFFGEGMPEEDRKMWASLGSRHPVFGTMETPPTFEEALKAGMEAGEKAKKAIDKV